jgi:site-specific recombinase XerD
MGARRAAALEGLDDDHAAAAARARMRVRLRLIEDMTIRKLAPKTQQGYIRTVKDFAAFLGRSPDTASFEDVRRSQLHLVASGTHISILNHTVAALRFFFRITLKRSDIIEHTTFIHQPRNLPVVLSPEEVAACWMRRRGSNTRRR